MMIAVAIVAILVAMAVPAFTDYTIRAKVAECIHNSAVAKIQISEYRQTLGPWPPDAASAALSGSVGDTDFCIGFDYAPATGAFTIDVDEGAIDSGIVGVIAPMMTPTPAAGNNIDWNCTVGTTSLENIKYLPSTCRDA